MKGRRLRSNSRGIEGTPLHIELRQRESQPSVKTMWRWVDARTGKHSPKSKMAAALPYATKQRNKLKRFLLDAHAQQQHSRWE